MYLLASSGNLEYLFLLVELQNEFTNKTMHDYCHSTPIFQRLSTITGLDWWTDTKNHFYAFQWGSHTCELCGTLQLCLYSYIHGPRASNSIDLQYLCGLLYPVCNGFLLSYTVWCSVNNLSSDEVCSLVNVLVVITPYLAYSSTL